MHATWKKICIVEILKFLPFNRVNTFSEFIYTVSCVPAAKVNHVIPCFSIRWKSKGSLLINHLILNLS